MKCTALLTPPRPPRAVPNPAPPPPSHLPQLPWALCPMQSSQGLAVTELQGLQVAAVSLLLAHQQGRRLLGGLQGGLWGVGGQCEWVKGMACVGEGAVRGKVRVRETCKDGHRLSPGGGERV